jgi:endonuclease YncB( thermonuclease family)
MGNCLHNKNILKNATNDVPFYSLDKRTFFGKIVDVYDGDTCTIVIKNNKELQKYKVRMLGYDSPEIKPKKIIDNREKIIKKAKDAKNALITPTDI